MVSKLYPKTNFIEIQWFFSCIPSELLSTPPLVHARPQTEPNNLHHCDEAAPKAEAKYSSNIANKADPEDDTEDGE